MTHDSVKVFDAFGSFLDRGHADKTEPTGAVRLLQRPTCLVSCCKHEVRIVAYALVIDDGHFFNPSIAVELVFKVAFLGANAESEDTKHV